MSVYIINLILIILLYVILFKKYKTDKSKDIFCICIFVLFSVIQGLRSFNVGSDTENYVHFFELAKKMSITDILFMRQWSIEPGYGLLMKICAALKVPSQVYLLIVSMIINGGTMYFIYKYSDNPFVSVIVFMGVEFFTLSFTALRQIIAVIIVLNSYRFIQQKNLIKFILMILLATTIHKTALVFLPVYFLKDVKINIKTIVVGILLILIAQVIAIPMVEALTEKIFTTSYISSVDGGITQTIVILVYLLLGIFVYKESIKKENGTKNLIIIMIYFSLLIQSLAIRINMINRLMWYFYIFIIIYLPNMKKEINKTVILKDKEVKISTLYEQGIILLSIVQYLFFSMNMYNVVPYHILNL